MNLMTLHFQTVPATKKSIFVRGGETLLHGAKQQVSTGRIPAPSLQQQATQLQQGLMAPQPSSLSTSFRALSITRIEIKESVIYGGRRQGFVERKDQI